MTKHCHAEFISASSYQLPTDPDSHRDDKKQSSFLNQEIISLFIKN